MIVVMLGQIGSGKTVQAERIAERDGYNHFSVGTFIRERMSDDPRMMSGELVDSRFVEEAIAAYFESIDPSKGVVVDGFPRTLDQKEWLDVFLASHELKVERAFLLEVDDEEVERRLADRGRADDRPEAIARRMAIFEEGVQKIAPAYEHDGVLYRLDGHGTIDEVFERLERAL